MTPRLAQLLEAERQRLRAQAMPSWVPPMLATAHEPPFSRAGWLYERKLDGVRVLVFRSEGGVRIWTRNRKDRSATYFELRDAVPSGPDLIVDGEIVAESFAALQGRMQIVDEAKARRRARQVPVALFLFDVLHLNGIDLCGLPLRTRKAILRDVVPFEGPLRYLPHSEGDGVACWREACDRGWEGLIAKDGDSTYRGGERSKRWLKLKCVARQELVVGGFTEPRGARIGFGALLVGYYEDGRLRYAGKVGTGWDSETLVALRRRMERIERGASPFDPRDALPPDEVHFLEPLLVAEVGFAEWTPDGKLRHPRYLGLRDDRDPRTVVREPA